jgi:chemotaxis regulatin CheY-phosphate phosphatase CheZ
MRISQINLQELDGIKYRIEVKGDIKLYIDDYELARDWLDDDLYNQLLEILQQLIIDSIVTNKNPYYEHKKPFARETNQIKGVLASLDFQDLSILKVVQKCMKKTKLPEDKVIEILKEVRPDFNFDSDWKNQF